MNPETKFDPSLYLAGAGVIPDFRTATDISVDPDALDQWTHRRFVTAMMDGKVPAERINGRWYIRRVDRQRVAELMGVVAKPRLGRPPQRRADPASSSHAVSAAA